MDDRATLTARLKGEATRVGFDLVGIASAVTPPGWESFREWLARGFAGEMEYLPQRETAYEHPKNVLASAKSVVLLAVNYRTADPGPIGPDEGRVSRYAWGSVDYHDLLRSKLKQLADFLHAERPGCRTRGIVDTAPLLERDFARLAGLGWFGKNTMLINKRAGSWLFLAALLVDLELDSDQPHDTAHCGTCTRCLDACPTDAFPEPYVLDARKCISYLTIELRGPIPEELRSGMGEWLFGCDVCQDVCPWNHKAPVSEDSAFYPKSGSGAASAVELLQLDDPAFRKRFAKSPLARPKRAGLLRNAAVVLGNSGDSSAVPALVTSLDDGEPLVRGGCAWALGTLGGEVARQALSARLRIEDDEQVIGELKAALECVADASPPSS